MGNFSKIYEKYKLNKGRWERNKLCHGQSWKKKIKKINKNRYRTKELWFYTRSKPLFIKYEGCKPVVVGTFDDKMTLLFSFIKSCR